MIHKGTIKSTEQRERLNEYLKWEMLDRTGNVLICAPGPRAKTGNAKTWAVYDRAVGEGKAIRVIYPDGSVETPTLLV